MTISPKRKKILILFCGGADFSMNFNALKPQELMKNFSELQIIAQAEVDIFYPEPSARKSLEIWKKLAKRIYEKFNAYDGFVITYDASEVLLGANLLTYMLTNLHKPVIITGAARMNFQANLLNAVQAASMNFSGVFLAYGRKIIKAVRAQVNFSAAEEIFFAEPGECSGEIGFGINLNFNEPAFLHKGLEFNPHFAAQIKIIDLYAAEQQPVSLGDYAGILLNAHLVNNIPKTLGLPLKLPILVYTQGDFKEQENYILAKTYTYEAAVAKFMWALGQTKDVKKLREYFRTDLTGEIMQNIC